jgi:hypothetical protein
MTRSWSVGFCWGLAGLFWFAGHQACLGQDDLAHRSLPSWSELAEGYLTTSPFRYRSQEDDFPGTLALGFPWPEVEPDLSGRQRGASAPGRWQAEDLESESATSPIGPPALLADSRDGWLLAGVLVMFLTGGLTTGLYWWRVRQMSTITSAVHPLSDCCTLNP